MGYNSNCYSQNCYWKCCNYYGYCPQDYPGATSRYNTCYYYYSANNSLAPGVIAAIVVGSVLIVAFIIAMICWCRRRNQQVNLPAAQYSDRNLYVINPGTYPQQQIIVPNQQPYPQPHNQPPYNPNNPQNLPAYPLNQAPSNINQ